MSSKSKNAGTRREELIPVPISKRQTGLLGYFNIWDKNIK